VSTSADIAISEQGNVHHVSPWLPEKTAWTNPVGQLFIALLAWIASVVLLILPQFLAIPYLALHYRNSQPTAEILLANKTFILMMVAGVLPVHVMTMTIVWLVATRFGEVSIVEGLGLTWNGKFKHLLPLSIGLAILLYVAAVLIIRQFGGQGTALDKLVESSRAAALTIAFLAVATAPIVEESIYRGILYPAFERISNAKVAVILVTVLFAVPHVPQYWPNIAIIGSITLLSVVLTILRAYTGRLLPCIVVHFVFNGIQSIIIVLEPYLRAALEYMRHARPGGLILRSLTNLY